MLRNAVKIFREFILLVGGLSVCWGLWLQYPGTEWPVTITAENPLFAVDLIRFRQTLQSANLSTGAVAGIYSNLPVLSQYFLNDAKQPLRNVVVISYREKYFRIDEISWAHAPSEASSDTLKFQLKTIKNSLGYSDIETNRKTTMKQIEKFSNDESLHDLRHSPGKLYSHLWRFDLFSEGVAPGKILSVAQNTMRPPNLAADRNFEGVESNIVISTSGGNVSSAFVLYIRDPFYGAGEKITDPSDKVKFYAALREASWFYSWFSIENRSARTLHDVGLKGDIEGIGNLGVGTEFLSHYGIDMSTHTGTMDFHIRTIGSGDKDYKIIVFTGSEIFGRERLSVNARDVIAGIAEFAPWISLLAAFLVLLSHAAAICKAVVAYFSRA